MVLYQIFSSSGKRGSFQQHFSVYGKKGENCQKSCNNIIEKIVLANRASFFVLNVKNNKVDRISLHIYIILKIYLIPNLQLEELEG